MKKNGDADLSRLPSMTALLQAAESLAGLRDHPRVVVTQALRDALEAIRLEMLVGPSSNVAGPSIDSVLRRAQAIILARSAARLVRVINATGVILHTGLGRSVLADEAVQRVVQATGYCNLEINLDSGKRGRRGQYAEQILCRLSGAQAAFIVNNNAAATMIVLNALARGREVIVSRGQLIEIGGSFRLPEVMAAGGAILREVGTTNKTHLSDYEKAINDKTALIMHVHTSNYRVMGFTESPGVAELVGIARPRGLPVFDDLGSGALLDDALWSAADEPTAVASLRHGADVVAFSGDKLLGGPQAGILLGSAAIIDRLRNDPMARALRIDKLTAAALEATLELYQSPGEAMRRIPTLAALTTTIETLTQRAEQLGRQLRDAAPDQEWRVDRDESFAGGGSLPAWPLPTAVVRCKPTMNGTLDDLTRRLRLGQPAVLARVNEGALVFDLRTIDPAQFDDLVAAVVAALCVG